MKDGSIALESTTKDLQNELTQNFTVNVELKASLSTDKEVAKVVQDDIIKHTGITPAHINLQDCTMSVVLPYHNENGKFTE